MHCPRPAFTRQLGEAAERLGAELTWHSDGWIATVAGSGRRVRVYGYHFPLNQASSARLADDKVACSQILAAHALPAVRHELVRFGPGERTCARDLAGDIGLPLVLKPLGGSGGAQVRRAASRDEVARHVAELSGRHHALAVAPYLDYEHEYRIVVLDQRVLLRYRKVRGATAAVHGPAEPEWRHNLRLGAHAELVHAAHAAAPRLDELALAACAALELRFASVDVAMVGEEPQVLEVNSTVVLERFSHSAAEHAERAAETYHAALSACFDSCAYRPKEPLRLLV